MHHIAVDEFCVFQQIGWLDENYEFDNATAMADIASLPEAVILKLKYESNKQIV